MNKRILAIFLSLIFVLSAFTLWACEEGEESQGSSDSSVAEETNSEAEQAKKLLSDSIKAIKSELSFNIPFFNIKDNNVDFPINSSDLKGEATLNVNSFSLMDNNLNGQSATINLNGGYDHDNKAFLVNAKIDYAGEMPTGSAIITENGIFITDLSGVNDKAIHLDEDTKGLFDKLNNLNPNQQGESITLGDVSSAMSDIANILLVAIGEQIPDDNFKLETKTVAVDGVSYENASVVSMTISKESAEAIYKDVIINLLEFDFFINTIAKQGYTADEIKNIVNDVNFDEFQSLKIESVIDCNSKPINTKIHLISNNDKSFAINVNSVGENLILKAGKVNENGDYLADNKVIFLNYTFDQTTKSENLSFGWESSGGIKKLFDAVGTFDGDKHEGKLSVEINGMGVSANYVTECNADYAKLTLKEVGILNGGLIIPESEISVWAKMNDKVLSFGMTTKAYFPGFIDIDVTAEGTLKTADLTVTAPEEYIEESEIPEETQQKWEDEIKKQFPKFNEFFNKFINKQPSQTDDPTIENQPQPDMTL